MSKRQGTFVGMKHIFSALIRPGHVVRVIHCFGGYELPDGLPDGALVKVVACDIGYFEVEHAEQQYTIAMACVDRSFGVLANVDRGMHSGEAMVVNRVKY